MIEFDQALALSPYGMPASKKEDFLYNQLFSLTHYHMQHCKAYHRMLNAIGFELTNASFIADLPFLPVSLFKDIELKSVADNEVFKTLNSSGTTGQRVSRIYLDRATAAAQQKVLTRIVVDALGASRLPMLIIDSPSVLKDRTKFTARGAGILGFSLFGTDRTYALKDDMTLDFSAIESFLQRHQGKKIFLFGFTFMVWQHFYKALAAETHHFDISNGILLHGGGWKKLVSEAVSPEEFKARLERVCGLSKVCDYYGMAEQTGSIYMQCEEGHLHTSIFSDVIIRNPLDFSVAGIGEKGIIQVLSILPRSYPGHSLLTEDEGILLGQDDCPCGRKGKYFSVLGRLKQAEIRGCSDTYASKF